MQLQKQFLRQLGVYGFDKVEPLILAALVSEDPILLIGKAGTGKTFLLNSISEALHLEHRHYNASLVSFDDLIGFPFPSADGASVKFLPTPATIWGAESILIDELSRCKPEIQNKFFSVIHEKKIQGLTLDKLRFRWAAMNPFRFDGGENEDNYSGSEPLDQALADRFAFIIEVPDWIDLSKEDQDAVIYPAGEGAISNDHDTLLNFLQKVRPEFKLQAEHPLPGVVNYCRIITTILTDAGLRVSPRRARMLARNITSLLCVLQHNGQSLSEDERKKIYKLALYNSIPQRAWKDNVPEHIIDSAHIEAVKLAFECDQSERWVSEFLMLSSLGDRIKMIIEQDADIDTKNLAIMQMITKESKSRMAVFAFAAYPVLRELEVLGEEALNELSAIANEVMLLNGKMEWRELISKQGTSHPTWSECTHYLKTLPDGAKHRKQRGEQIFLYLITKGYEIADPGLIERELQKCFMHAAMHSRKK